MRKVVGFFAVLMLVLCGPALAQLDYGDDYTTSDTVWSVTHVKVDSNMIEDYLQGIRQTWATAMDVSKELGQIEDYAVYTSELPEGGDYNVTLVIQYTDIAQLDAGRKGFKEFEAAYNKKISEDKQREIVLSYPGIRKIVGEYLVRQVEFK